MLAEPLHSQPAWNVPGTASATYVPPPDLRLINAVLRDDLPGLVMLLNQDAVAVPLDVEDVTGRSALDHALERKNFQAAQLLVRHGAKCADDDLLQPQLLVDLIMAGEMSFARDVAASRRRLTANHHLPDDHRQLQEAVFKSIAAGDVDLVALLADPRLFELHDSLGANALHYGVISPNPQMLPSLLTRLPLDEQQKRQLLNRGRIDGRTPLIQATLSNRPTAVAVMLRAGASPDMVDRKGDSALHKAAREGLLDVGRLLLAGGARTDLINHEQQTPLAMARQYGRPDFVQLLQAFGERG